MDVVVDKLTKRYTLKGSPAVFETSFTAPSGGITSLLGPSGSGKTTVLRCIAGLEPVGEGRIYLGDRDITQIPARERRLGFVFQGFALFPHLNVRDNVAFGLQIRGEASAAVRTRVNEMLDLTQLTSLADRFPAELSGGQKQRVGFARALAPAPPVLLLDEPFAVLDPRVREELRTFLRQLHKVVPLTTILVSHDQEEALELSDRIVVMEKGRVHQTGTPREIYDDPKTSFVASFVGTANVLPLAEGRAIVRPHDVKLLAGPGPYGDAVTSGTIERIATLGADVKLTVALSSGESVTVVMPRNELRDRGLRAGDSVHADLTAARVFVDDYVI